jgi:pyruvate kinase
MVDAGLNVARLDFAHGTHAEHAATIAAIRHVSNELGVPLGVLQDLPELHVHSDAPKAAHLAFGLEHDVDWVAIPFVRNASEVLRVKRFVAAYGRNVPVIAKIEKPEALDAIDEIIAAADGILVAPGDLGMEMPPGRIPSVHRDIVALANRASKPAISAAPRHEPAISLQRTAGVDVVIDIIDGTDAVMLWAEPECDSTSLEAVRIVAELARATKCRYPHEELRARRMASAARTIDTASAEEATMTGTICSCATSSREHRREMPRAGSHRSAPARA